jgi:uncharacterized membrane protein YphA (DoxX/SURF4 family)
MPAHRLHNAAPVMIAGNAHSIARHALQVGIGLVWIAAAVGKARTPAVTLAENVRRLLGGPIWAASGIAKALPMTELVIGLLLIAGWKTPIVSAVSAALFFLFAFLIGRATIRNSISDAGCGCFGAQRKRARAAHMNGPKLVARNFLLANLALMVALAGRCACSR